MTKEKDCFAVVRAGGGGWLIFQSRKDFIIRGDGDTLGAFLAEVFQ